MPLISPIRWKRKQQVQRNCNFRSYFMFIGDKEKGWIGNVPIIKYKHKWKHIFQIGIQNETKNAHTNTYMVRYFFTLVSVSLPDSTALFFPRRPYRIHIKLNSMLNSCGCLKWYTQRNDKEYAVSQIQFIKNPTPWMT